MAALSRVFPFMCFECSLHFASERGLSIHVRKMHQPRAMQSGPTTFTIAVTSYQLCPNCSKLVHLETHRNCPMAARRISSRARRRPEVWLESDFELEGEKDMTDPDRLPFVCAHCPKSFLTDKGRARHLKWTHDPRPFVCPSCPKCLPTEVDLQRHIKNKHPPLPEVEETVDSGRIESEPVEIVPLATLIEENPGPTPVIIPVATPVPLLEPKSSPAPVTTDQVPQVTLPEPKSSFPLPTRIDQTPLKCSECGMIFMDVRLLNAHNATHIALYRCGICGRFMSNPIVHMEHIVLCRKE